MKIKKIHLKNIRSYEDNLIEFPEGSILLSGDIGSGKTSILLGIEFALFGLQPGQRGHALLKNGKSQGGVMIEIEIDGKEVVIERTLKRGKTVNQDFCSIIIDGVKKEISVSELKDNILSLLNYPKEFAKKQNLLYKFTVYTPQEEMKQIILQDSQTRLNTLRHVFGIDKYKRILENVSLVVTKIREDKRLNEGMVLNLEEDKRNLSEKNHNLSEKKKFLLVLEEDLDSKRQKRNSIQLENEAISKKIEEKNRLQQEIEKAKIRLLNKKETIQNNNSLILTLSEELKKLKQVSFDESKIKSLEGEISAIKKEKNELSDEILKISSQISSLTFKNEDNFSLERKMSNLEICPTCLQNVDAIYRANILNKIRSEVAENNKNIQEFEKSKQILLEKIKKLDLEISEKEKQLQELRIIKSRLSEINEKENRIVSLRKNIVLLEEDVRILSEQIHSLKQSVFELEKFDNLFSIKQKELNDALSDEKRAEIKLAESKKEIEFLISSIDELKKRIQHAEEIQNRLKYLRELENWLTQKFIPVVSIIEKNVMIKLKSDFSRLFEEWFNMLVSDSFLVRLSDDFTPIIEQQDYEIDYAYLSGGERTAVALAYRLALNQVINSMMSKIKTKDIVILDEPTDGFSEQQLDKMRDVLQQLNVRQLIIVSHERKIEEFVENVIRIRKKNHISEADQNPKTF